MLMVVGLLVIDVVVLILLTKVVMVVMVMEISSYSIFKNRRLS